MQLFLQHNATEGWRRVHSGLGLKGRKGHFPTPVAKSHTPLDQQFQFRANYQELPLSLFPTPYSFSSFRLLDISDCPLTRYVDHIKGIHACAFGLDGVVAEGQSSRQAFPSCYVSSRMATTVLHRKKIRISSHSKTRKDGDYICSSLNISILISFLSIRQVARKWLLQTTNMQPSTVVNLWRKITPTMFNVRNCAQNCCDR